MIVHVCSLKKTNLQLLLHASLMAKLIPKCINKTIDEIPVTTKEEVATAISKNNTKFVNIGLTPELKLPSHPSENTPIIHFDQFTVIANQLMVVKHDTEPWMDTLYPNVYSDLVSDAPIIHNLSDKLTCKKLKLQDDWNLWNISKFQQLNKYKLQNMFG